MESGHNSHDGNARMRLSTSVAEAADSPSLSRNLTSAPSTIGQTANLSTVAAQLVDLS
jgi:hypothetical protein